LAARECASQAYRTARRHRQGLSRLGPAQIWLRLEIALGGKGAAQQGFLAQMRNDWRERLTRFGETVCVLEPQVKQGPGGLRDVHAVLWIAHARYGTRGMAALESAGLVEAADYEALRRAYDSVVQEAT
jgi:UTP:GlnB (protein PII) uridylyltransferase